MKCGGTGKSRSMLGEILPSSLSMNTALMRVTSSLRRRSPRRVFTAMAMCSPSIFAFTRVSAFAWLQDIRIAFPSAALRCRFLEKV